MGSDSPVHKLQAWLWIEESVPLSSAPELELDGIRLEHYEPFATLADDDSSMAETCTTGGTGLFTPTRIHRHMHASPSELHPLGEDFAAFALGYRNTFANRGGKRRARFARQRFYIPLGHQRTNDWSIAARLPLLR